MEDNPAAAVEPVTSKSSKEAQAHAIFTDLDARLQSPLHATKPGPLDRTLGGRAIKDAVFCMVYAKVNDLNGVFSDKEDREPRSVFSGQLSTDADSDACFFRKDEDSCPDAEAWLRDLGILPNDFEEADKVKGTYLNQCTLDEILAREMSFSKLGFVFMLTKDCLYELIGLCESVLASWARSGKDFGNFQTSDFLSGWIEYKAPTTTMDKRCVMIGSDYCNRAIYEHEMVVINIENNSCAKFDAIRTIPDSSKVGKCTELWTWELQGQSTDEVHILPHKVTRLVLEPPYHAEAQETGPKLRLPVHPFISCLATYKALTQLTTFGGRQNGIKYNVTTDLEHQMRLMKYLLQLVQCPSPAYMWTLDRPHLPQEKVRPLPKLDELGCTPNDTLRKYHYDQAMYMTSRAEYHLAHYKKKAERKQKEMQALTEMIATHGNGGAHHLDIIDTTADSAISDDSDQSSELLLGIPPPLTFGEGNAHSVLMSAVKMKI